MEESGLEREEKEGFHLPIYGTDGSICGLDYGAVLHICFFRNPTLYFLRKTNICL